MNELLLRKSAMTLVEVLVGMALASLLLTGLLGAYRGIQLMHGRVEAKRLEYFQERFAQYRLSQVLSRAVATSDKDYQFFVADGDGRFSNGKTLVFSYDRGVDLRSELSNTVLARLYIDGEHQLCLAVWPAASRWKDQSVPLLRKEILLSDVERIDFSFYMPPDRRQGPVDERNPVETGKEDTTPAPDQWHDTWRSSDKVLPPLMKVIVTRSDTSSATYAFALPKSKRHIIYGGG